MDECKPLVRGRAGRAPRGRAVQVDPIQPALKPPGIKRLKLKYDKLLSILLQFAFKFNLHRYTVAVKRLLAQFHELARKELATLIASDEHPNILRCFAMEVWPAIHRAQPTKFPNISPYALRCEQDLLKQLPCRFVK